jgi:hypothetical protein
VLSSAAEEGTLVSYLTYAANVTYSLLHVRSFIAFSSWQYSSISVSTDLREYLRALNLHSDRQTESNKWFIYTSLPSFTKRGVVVRGLREGSHRQLMLALLKYCEWSTSDMRRHHIYVVRAWWRKDASRATIQGRCMHRKSAAFLVACFKLQARLC